MYGKCLQERGMNIWFVKIQAKPGVDQQAKFEYSPLGKIFKKGLEKSDKKEGILKWFKNFEAKNEE